MFSDLMLHRMGPGLADGISQGQAGPDEFRTTPLWGVGQRMFFLHDGRTSDLMQAILLTRQMRAAGTRHPKRTVSSTTSMHCRLSDKQAILDFLRSL